MDPERLLDALTTAETNGLIAALERRGLVTRPSVEDILTKFSLHTRERADKVTSAMVEKFGVAPEDIEIVAVARDDEAAPVVVMLATANALKKGSWDDILAERDSGELTIEAGGVRYDTCSGMTWRAYQALVAQLSARGEQRLPDSQDVAEQSDQPWTCTLLTGEEMDAERVPFAFVNEGHPGRSWGGRNYTGGLRFRPAVVVEPPTS